jgi:hypothetical protein
MHDLEQAGAVASVLGQFSPHDGMKYGWHQARLPLPSPETTPTVVHHFQAMMGYPPLHPYPHTEQQVRIFSMEILGLIYWLLTMQYLSVMASAAPNDQHEPQLA